MITRFGSDYFVVEDGATSTFIAGVNLLGVEVIDVPVPGTDPRNSTFEYKLKISTRTGRSITVPMGVAVPTRRSWTQDKQGALQAMSDMIQMARSCCPSGGGDVDEVVGGVGIDIDSTDPAAPIVNLEDTAVAPGAYTSANITIDQQGRITAAANGSAAGITQLTGDVTAGPGSGSQAATLASVISAGGPTGSATVAPIVTYDAKGRLTAVSSATITPAVGSITGLGTGVGTALAQNADTASGFVTQTGGDARYQGKNTSINIVSILQPSLVDWVNMPAALTFFVGQNRWIVPMDLSNKLEMKLHVTTGSVGGAAGAKIRLLYRTQAAGYSTTITDYTTVGTSEVEVTVGTSVNTLFSTAWIPIIAGAKDNVIVALAGIDGDSVADPRFLNVYLETR